MEKMLIVSEDPFYLEFPQVMFVRCMKNLNVLMNHQSFIDDFITFGAIPFSVDDLFSSKIHIVSPEICV